MEDRINEVEIKNSEIKEVDVSLTKVVKSICKITYSNKCGTGFLIKLYQDEKELFCLMTNHHVITKELVDSKEMINVKYNYESKLVQIKLDTNKRLIISDPTLDFTIIDVHDIIKDKYFLSPNTKNINYTRMEKNCFA